MARDSVDDAIDTALRALPLIDHENAHHASIRRSLIDALARFVDLIEKDSITGKTPAELTRALEVHDAALEFLPYTAPERRPVQRRRRWVLLALDRPADALDAVDDVWRCWAAIDREPHTVDVQAKLDILLVLEDFGDGERAAEQRGRAIRAAVGGGFGTELAANDEQRRALRDKALSWLRADFARAQSALRSSDPTVRDAANDQLDQLVQDDLLALSRDDAILATLPAAESEAWKSVWSEMQQALDAAR